MPHLNDLPTTKQRSRRKGGLFQRGHYGDFAHVTCPQCAEDFTRKQPGHTYCDILCYEAAARARVKRKLREKH